MAHRLNLTAITLVFILAFFALSFSQETLTITTYYPSPYGSYRELRSVKMAIGDSYYDRNNVCWAFGPCPGTCPGGSFCIPGPPAANASSIDLVVQGQVGIGTYRTTDFFDTYQHKLSIVGTTGQEFMSITGTQGGTTRTTVLGVWNNAPSGGFVGTRTNHPFIIRTVNASKVIINPSGTMLISSTKTAPSNNAANKLEVDGGAVVGTGYAGTRAAPINGLLVQGNVGIGTTGVPVTPLEVNGFVRITDGTQGLGKVLTSGATGTASWQYASLNCRVRSQPGNPEKGIALTVNCVGTEYVTGGGCTTGEGVPETAGVACRLNTYPSNIVLGKARSWTCTFRGDNCGSGMAKTAYAICCD